MKKTTNSKSKKFSLTSGLNSTVLYIALLTALALISIGLAYKSQEMRRNDYQSFRTLVKEAVASQYVPTAIEPKEKMQYIYESSVRFPVAKYAQSNFQYSYSEKSDDNKSDEEIQLTTRQAIRMSASKLQNSEDPFSYVSLYQRCSKEFIIKFEDKMANDDFTQITSKKLKDGRTAYIYKNKACTDFYSNSSIKIGDDEAIVKQVDSY